MFQNSPDGIEKHPPALLLYMQQTIYGNRLLEAESTPVRMMKRKVLLCRGSLRTLVEYYILSLLHLVVSP